MKNKILIYNFEFANAFYCSSKTVLIHLFILVIFKIYFLNGGKASISFEFKCKYRMASIL